METARERGSYVDPSKRTFEEASQAWYETKTLVRASTLRSYDSSLKLLNDFNKRPLQDISSEEIAQWSVSLDAGPTAVRKAQSVMGQIFRWAAKDRRRWVTKNPVESGGPRATSEQQASFKGAVSTRARGPGGCDGR